MTVLKEWLLGICLAAILLGVVRLLSPSGPLQRTMQTVTALVFIGILLHTFSPFVGEWEALPEVSSSFVPAKVVNEEGMVWLEQATVRQIASLTEHTARMHGVTATVTNVKTSREANDVSVTRVSVRARGEKACVAAFQQDLHELIGEEIQVEQVVDQ